MSETKIEPERQFWNPGKIGEELKGNIQEFVTGDFGIQAKIMTEDGKIVQTSSHKVLQSRLKVLAEGDIVRIVYTGEEPPSVKGQNPTKLYDVFKVDDGFDVLVDDSD